MHIPQHGRPINIASLKARNVEYSPSNDIPAKDTLKNSNRKTLQENEIGWRCLE